MPVDTSNDMIDPSLSEAISDWKEYSAESAKNALIVLEAITPVKDSVQVTQQVIEALKSSRWRPGQKVVDPEALIAAGQELVEIQKAAFEKMLESYRQYLDTTRSAGEIYAGKLKDAGTPQQVLAAWLEASLSLVKKYQDEAGQQAANLGTIQTAYKAWWQNSLQNLVAR